jgi:hypothetical protein
VLVLAHGQQVGFGFPIGHANVTVAPGEKIEHAGEEKAVEQQKNQRFEEEIFDLHTGVA